MCRELVNELGELPGGELVMQFQTFEALWKERERAYICMRIYMYEEAPPRLSGVTNRPETA